MPVRMLPHPITLLACWMLWFQLAGNALAGQKGLTAFVHANLIPMTSAAVLPDQTVVVEGTRIAAVGPSGTTGIPADAKRVDCRGAFLMPGLADMHMHLGYDWTSDAWPVSPLRLYLANGVTTIRCFGPRGRTGRYGLTWRKEIDAGRLDGPTILTCGPMLRGHFGENPEHIVIRQKYQRFDFLKIYSFVTLAEFQAIMSAARRLGVYTVGHIPFQVGLDGVLAEGMDEIAHVEELAWEFSGMDRQRYFDSEGEWMAYAIQTTFDQFGPLLSLPPHQQERQIDDRATALADKLKNRPVPVCTTLVIDDLIVQKLTDPAGFLEKPENRYLPERYLERFRKGQEKHQLQFKGGEAFAPFKYLLDKQLLKALKAAGIPLLLATDAGTGMMGAVPGFSLHDELGILVENGFTAYEALAAGTVVASGIVKRMNGQDDFGTIVPGKRADLVVVEQNPLDDVTNARKIRGVMAAGRWYDRRAIAQMLDG